MQDNLYLLPDFKKKSPLYCRNFLKQPLFTKKLLTFSVGEVCNISNKYWPNKFEKY